MKFETPPTPQERKLKKELIRVGDSICEFIGVTHDRNTIEQKGEELKDLISEAEVLVTELAVFEGDKDTEEIEYFYKHVTQYAKDAQVEMMVPDPEKDIVDALTNRFADLANIPIAAAAVAYLVNKIKQTNDPVKMERILRSLRAEKVTSKQLSRRNFLKMGAAAAITVPSAMNVAGGLAQETKSIDNDSLLTEFFLHSIDYRDVCIAKCILDQSQNHTKILTIYGSNHLAGIKRYLENPELLEKKLKIYEKTFGLWSPIKTEVYRWKQ